MTLWTTLSDAPWVEHLGWTLIHSVWQIGLVGLVYGLILALLPHRSANLRYLAGCAALVLMVGLPTTTFLSLRDGTADAQVVMEEPGLVKAPDREEADLVEASDVGSTRPSPTSIELRSISAPTTSAATAPSAPADLSPPAVTAPHADAAVEPVDRFARLGAAMPWLVAGWLLGVVVLSVRPLWGLLTVRRLRRSGRSALPQRLQRTARELAERFRLKSAVQFVQSTLVEVPAVAGYFRPIVLLPVSAVTGLSAGELEMIVAHELAHVRRHDYLVNLLQTVIETLFFYHPATWWVSRQIRKERENCCDDAALAVCGDRLTYARALAGLAQQRVLAASVAPTLTGGSLLERIRRLVGRSPENARIRRPGAWLAGALLLGCALCVVMPVGLDAYHRGAVAANQESNELRATDTRADAADETSAERVSRKSVIVRGVVVDGSGQPVSGARITAEFGYDKTAQTADAEGQFALEFPSKRVRGATLLASGPGESLGFVHLPWEIDPADAIPPQRITLAPPRLVDVKVVDGRRKPVAGAKVVVNAHYHAFSQATTNDEGRASLAVPESVPLQFVLAEAEGVGVDYFLFRRSGEPQSDPYQLPQDHGDEIVLTLWPTRSLTVRAVDPDGKPLPGAQVSPWLLKLPKKGGKANLGSLWLKQTDDNGVVKYDNLPVANEGKLTIWVRKEGFIAQERPRFDTRSPDDELTATLLPLVPVTGRVVSPDGSPVAGIEVLAAGDSYSIDGYREATGTSDEGTFRFNVNPDHYCVFVAGNDQWVSAAQRHVVRLGQPIDGIELSLQPATRVYGRLTAGEDKEPMQGEYIALYQKESQDGDDYYDLPEEERLPNPTDSRSAIGPLIVKNTRTDEDGRFEFHAGPGGFYLIGPRDADRPQFAITDQEELEINLHAKSSVEGTLKGRVVLQSNLGQGVAETGVRGYAEDSMGRSLRATSDAKGNFETKRSGSAELVGAFGEDDTLAAIVRVEAGAESIVLALGPTTVLRGTLIDEETGQAAAKREIGASIRVENELGAFMQAFRRSDTTDDAGRFEMAGIVPGHLYDLDVVVDRDNEGQPRSWRTVGNVEPTRAETVELGELRLPKPHRPPTIEDYIARAFEDRDDLSARITQRLADAELAYQQVLVVVADPESNATRQFFQARHHRAKSNQGQREALANYMLFAVDLKQTAFLHDLGVAAPDRDGAKLAVLNPDGRVVVEAKFDDLTKDGKLDRVRLTEFLDTRRIPLPDADKELASALATALREDKRVLVQVGGPGCAPCVLLSRYLDSRKELISKDYVYLKLDSRMPSADAVIGRLRETSKGGIPWMVILSADGKALITSDSDEGNIGYPSSATGKAHFERMLRTTRRRLSDGEISALLAGLEE